MLYLRQVQCSMVVTLSRQANKLPWNVQANIIAIWSLQDCKLAYLAQKFINQTSKSILNNFYLGDPIIIKATNSMYSF